MILIIIITLTTIIFPGLMFVSLCVSPQGLIEHRCRRRLIGWQLISPERPWVNKWAAAVLRTQAAISISLDLFRFFFFCGVLPKKQRRRWAGELAGRRASERGPDTATTLEGNYPYLFAAVELPNKRPIRAGEGLAAGTCWRNWKRPVGEEGRRRGRGQGWEVAGGAGGGANNLITRQQPRGIVGDGGLTAEVGGVFVGDTPTSPPISHLQHRPSPNHYFKL